MKNRKKTLIDVFLLLCPIGAFALLDVWLRVVTRWINEYSIYAPAPNMFTGAWSVLLTSVVLLFSTFSKGLGRALYAVLYTLFLLLAIIEYGAYTILGKFLYISDFFYASEGSDYFSYAMQFMNPGVIIQILMLMLGGMLGYAALGYLSAAFRKKRWPYIGIVGICLLSIWLLPGLYGKKIVRKTGIISQIHQKNMNGLLMRIMIWN